MKKLCGKWNSIPIEVKASITYTICSIVQKSVSFITVPLFTRLLTQEQYGQATIYSSWSAIVSIFITLNLAYGSFSTAMVKFEDNRDKYISSVEGIYLALSIIYLGIYFLFKEQLNDVFQLPTLIMVVMPIDIIATNAILLWSGKKRFEYKYKSVALITLLVAFISPIVGIIFVSLSDERGYAKIVGYAFVNIVVGGIIFARNAVKGKGLFNKGYWKYALGFNIPLIVYYLSQIVFNQSDRLMISHMVGTDKAAIYSLGYTLATVLTFIMTAINNSYVPWYYTKIKENKQQENKKISAIIAVVLATLLSCVVWFSPEIISLLAGEGYEEAMWIVYPVAASILLLFYNQLFANVLFYYEEKGKLTAPTIIAAIINLVLNYALIPSFGFIVAAYTTLISYIVLVIMYFLQYRKFVKQNDIEDKSFSYPVLIGIFIIFIVLNGMGVLFYNQLVVRLVFLVVIIVICALKKNTIIKIVKELRSKNHG